ncbi:MAG: gas vesicle protein GvpJ [Streptosporangiaceae bacterium]
MATLAQTNPYLSRPSPSPRGLADIIDSILDKGLVIDAYIRISAIGIELITIDARIVIASVDTYLRWAEAVNRLDLAKEEKDLPELIDELREGGAKKETKGVLEGAGEKMHDFKEKETGATREKTQRRRRQSEE